MVHLSIVDFILIALYFSAVLFIGFRAARKRKSDSTAFFLTGRTLTLPIFAATLVSTWHSGILGVGEYSYRCGLSNWFVFGVPYYFFALIFALFMAKKIRATNFCTIPDQLEQVYNRRTAIAGGVLTFFLVSPAAYVLMLGVLAQLIFGMDMTLAIVVTTSLTVVYLYRGGLRSNTWANAFEFVLMLLGFASILLFCYFKFGGLFYIQTHVPPLHLTWNGGHTPSYILVWFFIALWTIVDPVFHQRCFAAKDGATARNGILVSIGFWFIFDFMTTSAGLYARALIPGLSQPIYSYPLLAEIALPVVAKGLFYIGMLATIMSTLSSLTLISAMTIGKDIVGRWKGADHKDPFIVHWTRSGLFITAVVSLALAIAVPSVVGLWFTIGTCIIPGLLIPVVSSYFERLRIPAAFALGAMLNGWFVSTASLLTGVIHQGKLGPLYWFGIEPIYPGLFIALLWWVWGRWAVDRQKPSDTASAA